MIREARARGVEVHFAALYGICGEKGYELPEGDPRRKYKGRCVLLGDRVVNQDFETATFADMGDAPTLLDGARLTDAYGCLPGHHIQQADAVQAYIQAPMKGVEVWISLCPEAIEDPDFW